MKTIEQFRDYCSQEMATDLLFLERERRRAWFKLSVVGIVAGCVGWFILDYMQNNEYISGGKPSLIAGGCLLAAVLVIVGVASRFLAREYKSAFKLLVMSGLIKFLDPNLQYDPNGYISGGIYGMANLFRQQAERYSGKDLVSGRIGNTPIDFSEVHSEYAIRRNHATNWVTIFHGLLFVSDFRGGSAGQTLVLQDVAQNLLGKLGQALQSIAPPVGKLVKFDDAEFERLFVVYSEDENLARTVLTPALMQRMVEFRNKYHVFPQLSFTGTRFIISLPFRRWSPCEAPLFGSIVNFANFGKYLEYIETGAGIIEDVSSTARAGAQKQPAMAATC
jgi:hypothetical protein